MKKKKKMNSVESDKGMDDDDEYEDDSISLSSSDDEITLPFARKLSASNKTKHHHHQHHKKRSREKRIYGVFWESNDDEDEDDDNEDDNSLKPRKKQSTFRPSSASATSRATVGAPPMFVQGATQTEESAKTEHERFSQRTQNQEHSPPPGQPPDTTTTATAAATIEKQSDTTTTVESLKRQTEMEMANQRFWDLVSKGRGQPSRTASQPRILRESKQEEIIGKYGKNDHATKQNVEEMTTTTPTTASGGIGYNGASHLHRPQVSLSTTSERTSALPTALGGGRLQKARPAVVVPVDPELGKWERHTKGIGMKLLAKMGYTGSGGLGKEKDPSKPTITRGISKPIEVKVRPANLGLGFGNFQEATKLKTNRQIEAEVRGLKIPAAEPISKNSDSHLPPETSSSALLPSTQDLLSQQSWKKRKNSIQQSKKRTFIPYSELLEQQKQPEKILDLRGPAPMSGDVQLGDEILYNVGLLLSTYESKLHGISSLLQSHRKQNESMQADIARIVSDMEISKVRQKKLEQVLEIIDRDIETLVIQNNDKTTTVEQRIRNMGKIVKIMPHLASNFDENDRARLQLSEVLVPNILGAVWQTPLKHWNILEESDENARVLSTIVLDHAILPDKNMDLDWNAIRKTIVLQYVVPYVTKTLSRWDPVRDDSNTALRFYEKMESLLRKLEQPTTIHKQTIDQNGVFPYENEPQESKPLIIPLADLVQSEIVQKIVYDKLLRGIADWKPRLNGRKDDLADRLDLWILPWLPYFANDKASVGMIVGEAKRKLKNAMTFLEASIRGKDGDNGDERFLNCSIRSLRPWCGILKTETIQNMVSLSVMPRLARYLAKCPVVISEITSAARDQWIHDVDFPFQMHKLGLLSNMEFLSLLEGELLPHWACSIHQWMKQEDFTDKALMRVADVYVSWKSYFYGVGEGNQNENFTAAHDLLRSDLGVCRCFYSVLLMIQAKSSSDEATGSGFDFDELCPLHRPTGTNYRSVLVRRKKEAKRKAADDLLRMEESLDNGIDARVRLHHRNQNDNIIKLGSHHVPTFRDVVEEYASSRDILFQPRMGINATKDGKQVFLFGSVPIYLDANVAYAFRNNDWLPMSLDDIAKIANQGG
jgi:tuftelin-interacting protein 11